MISLADKRGFGDPWTMAHVYASRAAAFVKVGDDEKAPQDADHAIMLDPDCPAAHFNRGVALTHCAAAAKTASPRRACRCGARSSSIRISRAI